MFCLTEVFLLCLGLELQYTGRHFQVHSNLVLFGLHFETHQVPHSDTGGVPYHQLKCRCTDLQR